MQWKLQAVSSTSKCYISYTWHCLYILLKYRRVLGVNSRSNAVRAKPYCPNGPHANEWPTSKESNCRCYRECQGDWLWRDTILIVQRWWRWCNNFQWSSASKHCADLVPTLGSIPLSPWFHRAKESLARCTAAQTYTAAYCWSSLSGEVTQRRGDILHSWMVTSPWNTA